MSFPSVGDVYNLRFVQRLVACEKKKLLLSSCELLWRGKRNTCFALNMEKLLGASYGAREPLSWMFVAIRKIAHWFTLDLRHPDASSCH